MCICYNAISKKVFTKLIIFKWKEDKNEFEKSRGIFK